MLMVPWIEGQRTHFFTRNLSKSQKPSKHKQINFWKLSKLL